MLGGFLMDLKWIWGRFGVDLGSIWDRFGIDFGLYINTYPLYIPYIKLPIHRHRTPTDRPLVCLGRTPTDL